MRFCENDTVMLLNDFQEYGLKKGDVGAVIMAFTEPNEAYEVEFVDDNGKTKAQVVLFPHQLDFFNK
ncbi:DUF4926 domain-containing protein [Brevibacillus centrosporus]|uniref:DUF4926 domain-containing protein n=1 Tax=Brevibacillus centrosporus TaxID=54910 RepID=UPI003D1C4388